MKKRRPSTVDHPQTDRRTLADAKGTELPLPHLYAPDWALILTSGFTAWAPQPSIPSQLPKGILSWGAIRSMRVYTLTTAGRRQLGIEFSQFEQMIAAIGRVLTDAQEA